MRSAIQENRWLSITDSLTDAFNRRYLMEQLPRELDRCARYGRALTVNEARPREERPAGGGGGYRGGQRSRY